MVGLLALTGGVSLAGVWVYKRAADQNAAPHWWQTSWQTVQETLQRGRQGLAWRRSRPTPSLAQLADETDAALIYGLNTATLALAVTTTARLAFPPLRVASLPLLVYLGIPSARRAYEQLWVDGRPNRALAETVVMVGCLVGGYYWICALGFWVYYGSCTLLAKRQQDADTQYLQEQTPIMAHLLQDGVTCAVPVATLHPGDQVILCSGELAPVDGLIMEGVGWLQPQLTPATTCALRKSVGDRVNVSDLVLVGRLCVQVLEPV